MNCLDEPVFMAVSKPMGTEFGIHQRLESCDLLLRRIGSLTVASRFSGISALLVVRLSTLKIFKEFCKKD